MNHLPSEPRTHTLLLVNVSGALERSEADVARFKAMCLSLGLRPGEVERHTVLGLLQLLNRRRVIAPGRYAPLAQTLADIGRADLVSQYLPGETIARPAVPNAAECSGDPAKTVPPRSVDSVVSDRDLAWLASRMGADWKQVGCLCLGMSTTDIFHCESRDQLDVTARIMAMLHKWRCRRGPAATYALLTSLLAEHEDFDRCLLEELERRASASDNTS